ncbi:CMGC kinase, putative [Eimeria tenella]|uniref:Cyclin-dependent kinase 2 homolog n=1 Tax=Eimeria tenella TaxID=5802 RepID=U6KZ34_EIMTE|nr:CMGC kinase, putative [Eimeria tenella]CDJ42198.1 CMGC kinase, putative [Eimeria tenella]|eukprot:XP_013232948.1 CMGC kinase, putative [Eimeria tenella]
MALQEFTVDLIQQVIPFRSPNPLEDPREHRLRLVERLGGGTYGDVYRAVEEPEDGVGGGETFAVKYYVDETRTATEDGLGCTTIRELSTISSCGTHPNLVRMRYLFVDQLPRLVENINQQRIQWARQQHAAADRESQEQLRRDLQTQLAQEELKPTQVFVFAAYELCEGGDLKKLLAKQRENKPSSSVSPEWGLPLRHAKLLAFQLLNGLAFLHNEKLCHRDLKPDNLMLTSENENCVLKIGDLGLCRSFRANAGEITPTVCTIYYRPLEVLLGRMKGDGEGGSEEPGAHYGLGADIWGAGCIIAEMFRGIPLFKGTQEFEVLIRVTKILGTPTEAEWTNCTASVEGCSTTRLETAGKATTSANTTKGPT